jgi:hypothetical protein
MNNNANVLQTYGFSDDLVRHILTFCTPRDLGLLMQSDANSQRSLYVAAFDVLFSMPEAGKEKSLVKATISAQKDYLFHVKPHQFHNTLTKLSRLHKIEHLRKIAETTDDIEHFHWLTMLMDESYKDNISLASQRKLNDWRHQSPLSPEEEKLSSYIKDPEFKGSVALELMCGLGLDDRQKI